MGINHVMKSLFPNHEVHVGGQLAFKPGQIIFGQVRKLYPNQYAEIQIGANKLMAKVEVPLTNGERYWLQVASADGETQLKLLTPTDLLRKDSSAHALLKSLSLSEDKVNQLLAKFLMSEHLPLSKDELIRASQLLRNVPDIQAGLNIIKLMAERNMPINEAVFKSLLAAGKELSTVPLMQLLQSALESENNKTQTANKIITFLQSWNKENGDPDAGGVTQQLKGSLERTGLFYESRLLESLTSKAQLSESLKPLLVQYLQESISMEQSSSTKAAEQLLLRMNGQQLLSSENGPIQQILYEIPIRLAGFKTELTMQWEGKRTDNGQIDPDYCRILFYLELENLKDTVVEMQVQNRIVTVNIMNDFNVEKLAKSLLPALKTGLKQMDYTLSAVRFKQPQTNQAINCQESYGRSRQSYTGVDIRV